MGLYGEQEICVAASDQRCLQNALTVLAGSRKTVYRSSGIGSAFVDLCCKVNNLFFSFIVVHQPLFW